MAKLGDLIMEYSGGRIVYEHYHAKPLGSKIANIEGLRSGTVDMTECAATLFSGQVRFCGSLRISGSDTANAFRDNPNSIAKENNVRIIFLMVTSFC